MKMFIFLGKGHINFIRLSQNSVMFKNKSFMGFGGKKDPWALELDFVSHPQYLLVVTLGKLYEDIVFQSLVCSTVKW